MPDLTKKVELYYGRVPLKGRDDYFQIELAKEKQFCAVYVQNDVPNDVHYETSARLTGMFGSRSEFAQENGSCVRPFYIAERDGEEVVVTKRGPIKVEKPQGPPSESPDLREIYREIILANIDIKKLKSQSKRIERELASFRAGGLFFNADIADTVVEELKKMGYEVTDNYCLGE